MMINPLIRPYQPEDKAQLVALWEACALTRPWNPPERDIAEKEKVQPELFLVMECDGQIIGSVMAAYDGHRGSVNYLAVHPDHQGKGYGAQLMDRVEAALGAMGCPKINLMVRTDNLEVRDWYEKRGYEAQDCIVLGRWL